MKKGRTVFCATLGRSSQILVLNPTLKWALNYSDLLPLLSMRVFILV